jgi:hypothetical protein
MVHRWMREERQRQMLAELQQNASAFVPLQLQPAPQADPEPGSPESQLPAASPGTSGSDIRIEIQHAGATVTVHWPLVGATQCAQMLRE